MLTDPDRTVVLMALAGVTARELAELVGWRSHSYLTRLLRGDAGTVGPAVAVRIAEVLGVGVDDLFVPVSSRIRGRGDKDAVA